MITIKNLSQKKVTVLRNAYKVSYEKPVNQIWSAGFYLPLNDPAAKKVQQLHFAELVDSDDEYIGLFRIMTRQTSLNNSGRFIKYDCSHVLSTLIDSTIEGYRETKQGWKTKDVIEWILSFQDIEHWQLGQCDFDRVFQYSFENQNGLADALFSITEPFAEDYLWTYDTTTYPWTINLIKPEVKPSCRIREGWNLKDLVVTENPEKMVNKIVALGKGDGINNLNFKKINNGKDYVEDKESQERHGLIEYIWKDERFTNEESLLASTQAMLEKYKRPLVSWKTTAVDLTKAIPVNSNIRIPKLAELRSGSVVQLWTTLFGVQNLRIVNESKSDVFGDPGNISLEIGFIGEGAATSLADLQKKMEIYKLSSVGATNKDTIPVADNCDPNKPLPIKFYVEEELKKVNKILFTYTLEKFRAYSRAIRGGGAIVGSTESGGYTASSTQGGGGSVQGGTSQSGGGSVQSATSSSGGGQTSSSNGKHVHTMFKWYQEEEDITGYIKGTYRTYDNNVFAGMYTSGAGHDLKTAEAAGEHTHTVSSHTHDVSINIPAHTHSFSVNIPTHAHEFSVPAHKHEIKLPDHIHEIEYGIWEYETLAKEIKVKIDGKDVGVLDGTSAERVNIVEWLYKANDGKINRGWHTIEIFPDDLARIVSQTTIYGFIGSTDGEEL